LKNILRERIDEALVTLKADNVLPQAVSANYQIDIPKNIAHGDYSSNIALLLAKPCSKPPRVIAETMRDMLLKDATFEEVVVAGPGFLNFKISSRSLFTIVGEILVRKTDFGRSMIGASKKVQIEFVSANPTGPLHVGHGRGATLGSALSSIYTACGFEVVKEYYVNDAGIQIKNLSKSLYKRYNELFGINNQEEFKDFYPGSYLIEIAKEIKNKDNSEWLNLPESDWIDYFSNYAISKIMQIIKNDLALLNIKHDNFFFESSLHEKFKIDKVLKKLINLNLIY